MGFSGFKDMLEISGMLVGKYWMLSKWYRSGNEIGLTIYRQGV